MEKHRKTAGVSRAAVLAAVLTTFAFMGSASADEYDVFDFCPSKAAGVSECLHVLAEGGGIVLGSKQVPIVNPVTLQGGLSVAKLNEKKEEIQTVFAATNGVTLSKTPQPVPGGLAGIVPSEKSPPLVKALIKFFFESNLTGVNSTLELAKPANEILVSKANLSFLEGVALKLPVKARLENPFLGKHCYVGSSSNPLTLELTAGETKPPAPNKPISGASGKIQFLDGGRILRLNGNELVDNAWTAPAASGCGGFFSFILDPIVSAAAGLPAKAGVNTAILKNTINTAAAVAINNH